MILFAVLSMSVSACAKTPVTAGASSASTDPHRAAWDAAKVGSYTLTVELACFCPRIRYTVKVADGKPQDLSLNGADTDLDSKEAAGLPLTVEDLFAKRDDAYAKQAVEVNVSYDSTLGYPTHLYIDQSKHMADEELDYTVTSFERTS
jgi:hypothetical protein